jgi:AcrR family transcriptional regulator
MPERRSRANAVERILGAAARCVVESGAAALSLHDVARAAGVSKALILYHFSDKDTLLARLVAWTNARVIARERDAVARLEPAGAIDALWEWLASELVIGEIRLLAELATSPAPLVSQAIARAREERRFAAGDQAATVFRLLSLTPRVPVALIADLLVAFEDGLAIQAHARGAPEVRVGFDVLWLALLGLT